MKISSLFLLAMACAVVTFFYTSLVPAHLTMTYASSPETTALERGEFYRTILFVVAVTGSFVSCVFAFWKPRVAAQIWAGVIAVVILRSVIPGFSPPLLFPYTHVVFGAGMLVQIVLFLGVFRKLRGREDQSLPGD